MQREKRGLLAPRENLLLARATRQPTQGLEEELAVWVREHFQGFMERLNSQERNFYLQTRDEELLRLFPEEVAK